MIAKASNLLRRFPKTVTLFRNSDEKSLQKNESAGQELGESREKVQLMEDSYQKVKMEGLQDRHLTGVDSLQRDILTHNRFDLLDPRIKPKVASLSTTMGLELSQGSRLTEVDLGKIKVKQENEVFLSEVDPRNIPEYYNVVFDYEKQISLVGSRLDASSPHQAKAHAEQSSQNQSSEMNVSTRRAFEQKSQEEISKEVFGVAFRNELSFKIALKRWFASILIVMLFYQPFIATYAEMDQCLDSIYRIEGERMQHLQKFKRQAIASAIISNPDMRV